MTTTGQFYKSGGKLFTTYDATPEGCSMLINDFYDGGYAAFYGSSFARSAGAPGYGDANSFGMFNPKYGMDITAAMFSSKAVTAALGKRAYDHEGLRLAPEMATYGLAGDFVEAGSKVFTGTYDDTAFLGIGASTVQDGKIPDSVQMPVDEIRVPYKELPLPYNYGLGLKALEGKDDTSAYKQYIDMIGTNYADLIDKTILRPITVAQPVRASRETSLNGLARIFSSSQDLGKTYGSTSIVANHILPWGTTWGDSSSYSSSSLAGRRCAADATTAPANRSNYDAQVVDVNGGTLSLATFDKLYMKCMQNWDTASPDGKFWIMSPLMWNKLNMLCKANNIYVNSVYTSVSMGGIKTVEGRDVGMLLNSYNNVPIVMSGNASFDYTSKTISDTRYGDGFLIDGSHAWMCVTSPVEVWSIENPAIMRDLQEHHVTHMRAELRADKFIGSGRITNVAAEA